MRIVFVTATPPTPARARTFGFVQHLSSRHEIALVTLCRTPQDMEAAGRLRMFGISVAPVLEGGRPALSRAASAVFSGEPLQSAYYASPRLREALLAEVNRGADIVQVEHLRVAEVARELPVPVIWDADVCASRVYAQAAAHAASAVWRRLSQLEAPRARAREMRLLAAFTAILAASEADAAALRGTVQPEVPVAPMLVVPSGVDLAYYTPNTGRRHFYRLVTWLRLGTTAGAAALSWLSREVLPRLWAARPEVRLTLVSDVTPRHAHPLFADTRVSLIAGAEDVRPYLAGATVALHPQPYASGTPTDILAAMACGTPVVATLPALDGLRALAGRDLLVARDPGEYIRHIESLLDEEPLWHALSHNGRAYVEREHSWPLAAQALERIYRPLVEAEAASDSAAEPVPAYRRMAMG